jgi:hypothetical protein
MSVTVEADAYADEVRALVASVPLEDQWRIVADLLGVGQVRAEFGDRGLLAAVEDAARTVAPPERMGP